MTGLNFDRQKPFYPYVINYIISQHGLLEIISRHFYDEVKKMKTSGLNYEAVIKKQEVNEPKQVEFIRLN